MAKTRLLVFAQHALYVSKAILPDFRSRFSKHIFMQPQLLAIICLMRSEDWSFRDAEFHLAKNQALRRALELEKIRDYTTLHRFLQRVEQGTIQRALVETIQQVKADDPGASLAVGEAGMQADFSSKN
jgi:hypothetical protein